MPIYDYRCNGCGHTFDRALRMAECDTPTKEECPECLTEQVVQVIGAPRIVAGVGGLISKTDSGFRDRLREIKKRAGRTSTIDV